MLRRAPRPPAPAGETATKPGPRARGPSRPLPGVTSNFQASPRRASSGVNWRLQDRHRAVVRFGSHLAAPRWAAGGEPGPARPGRPKASLGGVGVRPQPQAHSVAPDTRPLPRGLRVVPLPPHAPTPPPPPDSWHRGRHRCPPRGCWGRGDRFHRSHVLYRRGNRGRAGWSRASWPGTWPPPLLGAPSRPSPPGSPTPLSRGTFRLRLPCSLNWFSRPP